jgi:hypothetical protein
MAESRSYVREIARLKQFGLSVAFEVTLELCAHHVWTESRLQYV